MAKDDDAEKNLMGCLLAVLALPLLTAWAGFVISVLWGWFVVPLGAPAVGVWHAAGLCTLVCLMRPAIPPEDTPMLEVLAYGVIIPAVALAIGYLEVSMLRAGY